MMVDVGMRFQTGLANEPGSDDAWFTDELDAINAAGQMVTELEKKARGGSFPEPVAVWDERGDIVYLFAYGHQFRRV